VNLISWFFDKINRPNNINTVATMNVEIKKGEKKGEAWVPCTFETLSYGIDINPSLVKKKKPTKIRNLPVDEKFIYHPDTEEVQLDEDERLEEYDEVERCSHCGQPAIVAEVKSTKYRSCPLVEIELSNPATQDLIIPVNFGFNKWDVYKFISTWLGFYILGVYMLTQMIYFSLESMIIFGIIVLIMFFCFGKFYRLLKWIKNTRELGWKKYKEE